MIFESLVTVVVPLVMIAIYSSIVQYLNKIKELHWYPASLQETIEYTCRILYEYFGIKRSDKLLDKSLLTSDEFYNIKS